MAAVTLFSPQQQQHHLQQQQQLQPLGERDIANRMDVDPIPVEGEAEKKRKSDANGGSYGKIKKRESIPQKHCHQCHQHKDSFVECTVLTTRGKKTERCGKVFCQDCLKRRYDEDVPTIISAGRPKDLHKLLGHVQTESYVWRCPVCSKNCNCAPHRKQYGLAPAGLITSLAKERGLTVAQLLQDPSAMEAARLAKAETPKKSNTPVHGSEQTRCEGGGGTGGGGDGEEQKGKKIKKAVHKTGGKAMADAVDKVKEKSVKSMAEKVHKPIVLPASIKPFVKQPKHVKDPEFEFIGISYALEVIDKRLRVREFVLRFEKMIKLPSKYFRTINDPNSEWTDLTYRNLLTNLLPIIQADGNHLIHADLVYEATFEIKKMTPDNPKIWIILKNLLEDVYPGQLPDDFDHEEAKLDAIMFAIYLALQATIIRQQIDEDAEKERQKNKDVVAEIKKLKAVDIPQDWEQTKGELQKERLLLKPGERVDWDDRYAKSFNANKKLIAQVEEKQWFNSRKTCVRTAPLGVDAKGNTYWMFTQRDKNEEDWGQWIVVQKNEDLSHPSGFLPRFDSEPRDSTDSGSDTAEREDEETIKSRIWYAISGARNVRHLAEWIQYQYELVLYKKLTAASDSSSSEVAGITPLDSSKKNRTMPGKASIDTPSRKLMVEVRLPQRSSRKPDPVEFIAKESTEAFFAQLQKIAGFMELNEQPQKLL